MPGILPRRVRKCHFTSNVQHPSKESIISIYVLPMVKLRLIEITPGFQLSDIPENSGARTLSFLKFKVYFDLISDFFF